MEQLTPSEDRVLRLLDQLSEVSRTRVQSHTLAIKTGWTLRQIQRILSSLEQKGYVVRPNTNVARTGTRSGWITVRFHSAKKSRDAKRLNSRH